MLEYIRKKLLLSMINRKKLTMKRLCYIMIFIACFNFVLQVPIDVKASKLGTKKNRIS